MHDILKYRRKEWPEAVESVLRSVNGFETVVVGRSGAHGVARDIWAVVAGLEIPKGSARSGASELVRGLLWYSVDALPQAHAIFQEESGFLGSYCHGMMHRREGDFWNANYWFRSAGKPPAGLFEAGFSPERLTSACERAVQSPREQDVLDSLAEEAARVLDYLFEFYRP